eukprot:TRINITY_DN24222_c0_g1_i1.p1 TRINITY_DN24222_c0_g1~~TRINITY_DN24222_c0_g1_i1.p1  ORF type:complete len:149 (-),score=20.08 TRINITY_DN24222_c0_g1_i1:211-597(-)
MSACSAWEPSSAMDGYQHADALTNESAQPSEECGSSLADESHMPLSPSPIRYVAVCPSSVSPRLQQRHARRERGATRRQERQRRSSLALKSRRKSLRDKVSEEKTQKERDGDGERKQTEERATSMDTR